MLDNVTINGLCEIGVRTEAPSIRQPGSHTHRKYMNALLVCTGRSAGLANDASGAGTSRVPRQSAPGIVSTPAQVSQSVIANSVTDVGRTPAHVSKICLTQPQAKSVGSLLIQRLP